MDSAPKDQAEEALLCIDDGEFGFDCDDLDFTVMMAALAESVSITSDDGLAHDEEPVPRIPPQVQLVQRTLPLPSGASGSAAASASGLGRVPRPARAPAAAIPIMAFGMHNKKSFEIVAIDHPEYYFWGKTQPRPSVMLKEFLDWAEMQYDVDYQHGSLRHRQTRVVVNRVMPEEYKLSPKKGKAITRTLHHPLHQQPCAECCVNSGKRGSNATHDQLTCIVCCHSTTTARRQVPKFLEKECPHDNTDFRGSDKNAH